MEDPNLIATLIPVDDHAEYAFRHEHNEKRYLPPTRGFEEGPAKYEQKQRLRLTFDQKPKDPIGGYAFGTDQKKCDVLLAPRGVRGTTGVHFHITFDVIRGGKIPRAEGFLDERIRRQLRRTSRK